MNETYIFDACALIALLSRENGYKNVEKIIEMSKNKKANIIMHTVNVLEVYYHIYKLYDETSALNFLNEIKDSPIQLRAEITNDIIINAGKLKRQYPALLQLPPDLNFATCYLLFAILLNVIFGRRERQ